MPISSDIKGILSKDTAGLPNWAWILVVGAGIAAAYFIPKFLNNGSGSTTPTTGTDTTGSGIGLAIDPTTGLPYAVEGLVPSGANAGMGGVSPTPAPPLPTSPISIPAGSQIWQGTQSNQFFFGPNGPQVGESGQTLLSSLFPSGTTYSSKNGILTVNAPGQSAQTYSLGNPEPHSQNVTVGKIITVGKWPSSELSLSGLAKKEGISQTRLEQLNPGIKSTVKSGQKVRIT
jgi:hypothetical protein